MDKRTTRQKLEKLHTKLLEDILYTELVTDGRGFVNQNLFLIEQESKNVWDEKVAQHRVQLLEDTALLPPKSLKD